MPKWFHCGIDHLWMSHGFVALYHNDKLSINSGSRFGNAITCALMGVSGAVERHFAGWREGLSG